MNLISLSGLKSLHFQSTTEPAHKSITGTFVGVSSSWHGLKAVLYVQGSSYVQTKKNNRGLLTS